jgi:hypothetical protein
LNGRSIGCRIGALAALLLVAGCTSLPAGESVPAPAPRAAGTGFVYEVRDGYNGERRGTATLRILPAGSRLDGIGYQEPPEGGFAATPAPIDAREFNAAGELVRQIRTDGSATLFEPPLRVLPFPLAPGMRFRQTVSAITPGAAPRRVTMVGRVTGWETLRIGTHEVRALRVERDVFLGDAAFHRTETARREIDWYAPLPGLVVRASEDSQHDDLASGGGDEGGAPPPRRGDWLVRELSDPHPR